MSGSRVRASSALTLLGLPEKMTPFTFIAEPRASTSALVASLGRISL